MFKINNRNARTRSMTSLWYIHLQLSTYFTVFSSVSIVDLEQVNVS